MLGRTLGCILGIFDGLALGSDDGLVLGTELGIVLGLLDGSALGTELGIALGALSPHVSVTGSQVHPRRRQNLDLVQLPQYFVGELLGDEDGSSLGIMVGTTLGNELREG